VRYSDVDGNRILEYSEPPGAHRLQRRRGHTNGRTLDLDGTVVQCSHGRRAVERDDGRTTTTLVDRWNGRRLNSPNDVVVKSDGTIWFSDPSYGIQKEGEGHPGEAEYGDHVVFRFDPSSGELDPVVIDVLMPNGLAFSPDESVLYVADSSLEPPDGRTDRPTGHAIHAYDVVDGRRAKNGRTFVDVSPGAARRDPGRRARQRLELLPGRRAGVLAGRGACRARPGAGGGRQPVLRRRGRDGPLHHRHHQPVPDRHHDY
jgi:gluconolactonase